MTSRAGAPAGPPTPGAPPPPAPGARGILERLAAAGHAAVLVGGCVRDLLRGVPVADFDVATSAPPDAVLALFPRAVPVGLRHGTVMVPTPDGPVDVTTFRDRDGAGGGSLAGDLARRDFTVNAMAWEPGSGEVLDPFGGRADLAARRLRAVGAARDRIAEDPLRALRAARLAAQLDFEVDPEVEAAMAGARDALPGLAPERVGREIEALLAAPRAGRGLRLLRRAGLEAVLAPGTREDAADVVDRLAAGPAQRAVRLAAWLRGARAEAVLRRLRFPHELARRVAHLLALHPVEQGADPGRPAAVRRLLRRAGEADLAHLVALRRAELDAAPRPDPDAAARLGALLAAVERLRAEGALALRRRDLALDGRDVMRVLGRGAGPHVGEALEYLTDRMLEDPACNTPERLEALLRGWAQAGGPGRAGPEAPR